MMQVAGSFPSAVNQGNGTWGLPILSFVDFAKAVTAGVAEATLQDALHDLTELVLEFKARAAAGTGGLGTGEACANALSTALSFALADDAEAASEDMKAANAMEQAASNPTGSNTQDIVAAVDTATADLLSKWDNLAKAAEAAQCPVEVRPTILVFIQRIQIQIFIIKLGNATYMVKIVRGASWIIKVWVIGGFVVIPEPGQSGPLPTNLTPPGWPPNQPIIPQLPNGVLTTNVGSLPAVPSNLTGASSATSPSSVSSVQAGSTISISGSGLEPGSSAVSYIFSAPVNLGTLAADSNGDFSTRVTIPTNTPAGPHFLAVVGTAPGGKLWVLEGGITVTSPLGQISPALCNGTVTGTIHGGLIVPPGDFCTLDHTTVDGTVSIGAGAIFEGDASTINGGITATSPQIVTLCGDAVHGDVSTQSPELPVFVGTSGDAICGPTRIDGSLTPAPAP
jgi:hypothetical protein